MSKNGKLHVAIIGVGNCASSLVQGVEFYKDAADDAEVPGLMHANLGGYHIRDIEFSAAFDVVKSKVGKDLSKAIKAHPNNTIKFADVPKIGVKVKRGMTHDGLGNISAWRSRKRPALPMTSSRSSKTPIRMWSSVTCRLALRWQPNGMWNTCSTRVALS